MNKEEKKIYNEMLNIIIDQIKLAKHENEYIMQESGCAWETVMKKEIDIIEKAIGKRIEEVLECV